MDLIGTLVFRVANSSPVAIIASSSISVKT